MMIAASFTAMARLTRYLPRRPASDRPAAITAARGANAEAFGPFPSDGDVAAGRFPPQASPRRLRVLPILAIRSTCKPVRAPVSVMLGLRRALLALVPLALVLSGCVETLDRARDAKEAERASIVGYGEIRTYLDARLEEAPRDVRNWTPAVSKKDLNFLMISGGGAGGAFSVGILSAWTKAKTRPTFDVVTGVSTGALIAPYAFLGSAYDDTLVHLYTSGVAEDLIRTKGFVGLFGSSLLRADPLRRMIEKFITPEILQQVAVEHRKGRRLFVLTTNLDTQRAVVWNMGAIANSGRQGALKLFQDVLIASASVPGVYPAVMIDVESEGRHFEEMHSDGGAESQVLMLPQVLLTSSNRPVPTEKKSVNFYVIVNNALMPEFEITPDKTLSILGRAYTIFVKSQTQSALTALYNYTKLTHAHFFLASIDVQLPYSMLDPFNTEYMKAVYKIGYTELAVGTLWKDCPIFR